MRTEIDSRHINWKKAIDIEPEYFTKNVEVTKAVLRELIKKRYPVNKADKRLVYIIRLTGPVTIQYPKRSSPTIYIGEGFAWGRITNGHNEWISTLLQGISEFGLRVHIAVPRVRKQKEFYRNFEADLIDDFIRRHGCIPLFNRQREIKYAGTYVYSAEAKKAFRHRIETGKGFKAQWAMIPTPNSALYDHFTTGLPKEPAWNMPFGNRTGFPFD